MTENMEFLAKSFPRMFSPIKSLQMKYKIIQAIHQ